MRYRRLYVPGGTYFFTLVTDHRRPIFLESGTVDLFFDAYKYVNRNHPFSTLAWVVLPEHIHTIWRLPLDTADFSSRWQLIKSTFSHRLLGSHSFQVNESRKKKGEKGVWQRRFWEHLIRDETDLQHHIDYIHYNPVKHGLAGSPKDWIYSSFSKYVSDGYYHTDWGSEDIWEGHPLMEYETSGY